MLRHDESVFALADFDRPRHHIDFYGGAPLQAPGRILATTRVRLIAPVHRDSRNRPDEQHSPRVSAGRTPGSENDCTDRAEPFTNSPPLVQLHPTQSRGAIGSRLHGQRPFALPVGCKASLPASGSAAARQLRRGATRRLSTPVGFHKSAGPATCVEGVLQRRGMIVSVSLRLLYLIFDRLLGWPLLLGRTPASKEPDLARPRPRTAQPDCPAPANDTTSARRHGDPAAGVSTVHVACARPGRPTPTGSAPSSTSTSPVQRRSPDPDDRGDLGDDVHAGVEHLPGDRSVPALITEAPAGPARAAANPSWVFSEMRPPAQLRCPDPPCVGASLGRFAACWPIGSGESGTAHPRGPRSLGSARRLGFSGISTKPSSTCPNCWPMHTGQRPPRLLGPGSPVRYHGPMTPLTLAATAATLIDHWRRAGSKTMIAATAVATGSAAAMTGYLVRTVNLPLLHDDLPISAHERHRLIRIWHHTNAIRLVALAAASLAMRRTARANSGTATRAAPNRRSRPARPRGMRRTSSLPRGCRASWLAQQVLETDQEDRSRDRLAHDRDEAADK
jgi:hypothetical protein